MDLDVDVVGSIQITVVCTTSMMSSAVELGTN